MGITKIGLPYKRAVGLIKDCLIWWYKFAKLKGNKKLTNIISQIVIQSNLIKRGISLFARDIS